MYPPRAEMIERIEDNGYKIIGYVKQASGGIEYTIVDCQVKLTHFYT